MLVARPSALPRLLVLAALLAGGPAACAPFNDAIGAYAGIDAVVMLPVFGKTTGDLLFSGITGRNCSVVRLEQDKTYCKPLEGPPAPPRFCTRSLGRVDCWAYPASLPGWPMPVADAPPLTPEQEANRTARWPNP